MPYIRKTEREKMDDQIEYLADRIPRTNTERAGGMNYAVSQLIRQVYGEHLKYHECNEIVGILECIKAEFYRVRVGPYEDKKITENGDLYIDKP